MKNDFENMDVQSPDNKLILVEFQELENTFNAEMMREMDLSPEEMEVLMG